MTKFFPLTIGMIASFAGALIGPGLAQAQSNLKSRPVDYIVAVVNSEPITNNEVKNLKLRLEKQLQPGTAAPSAQVLTQQALDQLINEKAQLQQARDNGIRIDDTEVDQTELNIARQNQVSKEELYKRIVSEGLSVSAFREQLRNQLMISRLRERDVDNRARISDTDIAQYLQSQQAGKPTASIPMATIIYILFSFFFAEFTLAAFFAGFLLGYLIYDESHYAMHHANFKSGIFKRIKDHHMLHHYSDPEKGFGVSSSIWDVFFNSGFPKKKPAKSVKTEKLSQETVENV